MRVEVKDLFVIAEDDYSITYSVEVNFRRFCCQMSKADLDLDDVCVRLSKVVSDEMG